MRMTLWGMMKFNDDILNINTLQLPEQLDKQILVDAIVEECGMMFPIHQQPFYLASNINNWFKRRYKDFSKLCEALYADYNPTENYNMIEIVKGSDNGTTESSTTINGTSEGINKVSGFNSSTLVDDTSSSGKSQTSSTNKGNDTNTYNKTLTRSGNIGVTTTQQMIESSIELSRFDIYRYIIEQFIEQFMLPVY